MARRLVGAKPLFDPSETVCEIAAILPQPLCVKLHQPQLHWALTYAIQIFANLDALVLVTHTCEISGSPKCILVQKMCVFFTRLFFNDLPYTIQIGSATPNTISLIAYLPFHESDPWGLMKPLTGVFAEHADALISYEATSRCHLRGNPLH